MNLQGSWFANPPLPQNKPPGGFFPFSHFRNYSSWSINKENLLSSGWDSITTPASKYITRPEVFRSDFTHHYDQMNYGIKKCLQLFFLITLKVSPWFKVSAPRPIISKDSVQSTGLEVTAAPTVAYPSEASTLGACFFYSLSINLYFL